MTKKTTLDKPFKIDNEQERLAKLTSYNFLNLYEQTGTFKHIASMAAHIFKVPIALVNFIDDRYVIAESGLGLSGKHKWLREISLCSMVLQREELTVFENTTEEPCLADNQLIHKQYGIQFYAGVPIKTSDGFTLGVMAIADNKPRAFNQDDIIMLEGLATLVMEELEEMQSAEILIKTEA
ncbi:MAG: serine/threonine protein kinase [Cytophagales bacterium CG18_big_fil_WC_8_21_14_2_50_42_9]|nr:MAG: serine/threonine protein kinase [Cytophagales bacterium CG18_big_fil_WC_8_21_14_2_50_42_9]